MPRKDISLKERHVKFIEENSLSLSKFVQRKLDDEIKRLGWVADESN